MNSHRQRTHAAMRGFTLVEVMVVIVILGLLATIVGTNVIGIGAQSSVDKAKLDISVLKDNVDMWQLRRPGRIPESLEELTVEDGSNPALIDELPLDPWDNEYIIEPHESGKRGKYVLISYGPDGEEGTEDDIRSDTMNKREDS